MHSKIFHGIKHAKNLDLNNRPPKNKVKIREEVRVFAQVPKVFGSD